MGGTAEPTRRISRDPARRAALDALLAVETRDAYANLMLPQLKCGDLIIGRSMGAYTWASATDFNFFARATVVAVNRRRGDVGGVQ